MRSLRLLPLLGCLSLALSCQSKEDLNFPYTTGGSGGAGHDIDKDDTSGGTDDTGDTDDTSDTDDSGDTGDTGSQLPSSEFDEPGDIGASTPDGDGVAEIDLSDVSGDPNTTQEFYLVLINTGEEALGYELNFVPTDDSEKKKGKSEPPPMPPTSAPGTSRDAGLSPFRAALREAIRSKAVSTYTPPPGAPPAKMLTSSDIGVATDDFRVRNDLEDESSVQYITTTLWAVGNSVAIWVDDDVPIDYDSDCDGVIDTPASQQAYGFNNCDLQTIADIVDTNILPNLTGYFGDVSDVNGDALVSVVITKWVNQLPLTSEDEDVQESFIGSYADPEVDLMDRGETNPGSNEQEVVFVFAPDPNGFINPNAKKSIEEYTDVELLSQISQAVYKLISYNQHVLENGGEPEEAWVREGMAALAADLTGFGSTIYEGAWDYLDATHVQPLTSTEDQGAIATEPYGAQYLFFRWIADALGTKALSSLVQTSEIGTDNIEAATGFTLDELVYAWQVAVLTYGETDESGDTLVDTKTFPPYADPTFISAPTSSPTKGDLYGANGYQQGININGFNYYYEGGTSGSPQENGDNRVMMAHADPWLFAYGQEFFGYVEESYAVQAIRLANVPFDETTIQVRGTSSDYIALVVRWNDPAEPDFVVEQSISATDQSNLSLLTLPTDGSPIYAVGDLSLKGTTNVVKSRTSSKSSSVVDTDRWLLDLSDRTTGAPVSVTMWLDRQYSNEDGDVGLSDPWIAVVPAEVVALPTTGATNGNTCSGGLTWGYPSSVLEHIYYQIFVSGTSYGDAGNVSEEDTAVESSSDFEPCGTASTTPLGCDEDWDGDGVADEDEPAPETFLEQVQTMQCTLAGGSLDGVSLLSQSIFDIDEQDDDDDAYYVRQFNLGGTDSGDGEGAFVFTSLSGGAKYLVVVGGGTDSGPYTLHVQEFVAN